MTEDTKQSRRSQDQATSPLSQTMAALGARLDNAIRMLSAISRLSAIPLTAADLDQASANLLSILVRTLSNLKGCSLLLHDEEQGQLNLLAAMGQGDLVGESEGPYNRELSFSPGQGIAGRAFAENRPLFWDRESGDLPMLNGDSCLSRPEALACLPLTTMGRRLGVLNVSFYDSSPFDQPRKSDLILLAGVAANIMQTFLLKAELDAYAAALKGRVSDQEEEYRRLFEGAELGIFRCSPEGQLITVNPALARIFGYASQNQLLERVGRSVHRLCAHPQQWGHLLELVAQGRDRLALEQEYCRQDGSLFPAQLHARAVRDPQGELLFLEGFVEDISQRKEAEEALQWEVTLNHALAELSEALLSSAELNRLGELVLKKAMDLTGSQGGLVGYRDSSGEGLVFPAFTRDIFTPAGPAPAGPQPEALWAWVLDKGQPLISNQPGSHLVAGPHLAQTPRVERLAVLPVLLEGRPAGLLALANPPQDFGGQQIQALEQLRELFALALHRHRAEKDKANLQAQLLQAHKMEAIGTLAGGIAHDFNNILMAIIGYTELSLREADPQGPQRFKLEQVLMASARATDLIKQILAFSRQSDPERKPIQMGPLIKETLRLMRASLPATIEIVADIAAEDGTVLADPTQIHQVLMNLCANGARAMDDQEGELQVKLRDVHLEREYTTSNPPLPPGTYRRLTVADTGKGIPDQIKERIFDPFFTTQKRGRGTGMGLAVVHGIVSSHGGGIAVYSEPGVGSAFHVYMPVSPMAPLPQFNQTQELATGNERLLIVDDEEDLAVLTRHMLEDLGYSVETHTSSAQALESFRQDPSRFDLVISDQTMPRMTGLELAAEMLRLRPDLPVMLLSGFNHNLRQQEAEQLGVRLVLAKPVTTAQLADAVRQVLDNGI